MKKRPNTEDFGWNEESVFNSDIFHRVWYWIDENRDFYTYDDDSHYDYTSLEEDPEDLEANLSNDEDEAVAKEWTWDWMTASVNIMYPVRHYDAEEIEREFYASNDYDFTVPKSDKDRFGVDNMSEDVEWNSLVSF